MRSTYFYDATSIIDTIISRFADRCPADLISRANIRKFASYTFSIKCFQIDPIFKLLLFVIQLSIYMLTRWDLCEKGLSMYVCENTKLGDFLRTNKGQQFFPYSNGRSLLFIAMLL